tara:strand:+ start:4597 stop:5463 length:867 start_codon:yes stop_codon:yes gene_type:complete
MQFVQATKFKSKLRLLIEGLSGSGKTWSSLLMAAGLGGKIAVIDSENGSSAAYKNNFDFDLLVLEAPFSSTKYIEAIHLAEKGGYDTIIIDSISHEWNGEGGCIDMHSKIEGNSYTAWAKITPLHNKFIQVMLASKCHIIATARTKSDVVMQEGTNKRGSKIQIPKKVGMKAEQRDGLDYEFTTVLRLDNNNTFEATKDRSGIFKDKLGETLTSEYATSILSWLEDGEDKPDINALIKDILAGDLGYEDVMAKFRDMHSNAKNVADKQLIKEAADNLKSLTLVSVKEA